jgi:hypothetical protein
VENEVALVRVVEVLVSGQDAASTMLSSKSKKIVVAKNQVKRRLSVALLLRYHIQASPYPAIEPAGGSATENLEHLVSALLMLEFLL